MYKAFAILVCLIIGFSIGRYVYKVSPVEVQSTNVKYKEFWKYNKHWAVKPILITEFDTVTDTVETEPIKIRVPVEVLNEQPDTRVWTGNVSRDDNYNINIGLWNSNRQIYEVNTYDLTPKFYWTHTISTGYPLFFTYDVGFNVNPKWSVFAGGHYEHITGNFYPRVGLRITF